MVETFVFNNKIKKVKNEAPYLYLLYVLNLFLEELKCSLIILVSNKVKKNLFTKIAF